jgi:arylsulfatase A-like enzyme
LENSVLLLVADHGQALGEHGWFGHGAVLWESVIHAPLVIVDYRNPQHRVVETTVGAIDLTPTILQLVGAEPLPTQGRSLLPALLGGALDPADYVVEIEQKNRD